MGSLPYLSSDSFVISFFLFPFFVFLCAVPAIFCSKSRSEVALSKPYTYILKSVASDRKGEEG